MLVILRLVFIFLGLSLSIYGGVKPDDTIVVNLDTELQLMPLVLTPIQKDQSAFEPGYIRELEKLLNFDLSHNGMTQVIPQEAEASKLATEKNFDDLGQPALWKKMKVAYVVKTRIHDKQLSARVLSVNTQTLKSITDLTLSGDLRYDRRQVHALADAIFKSIFGQNGIASTRLLYTVKTKGSSSSGWKSEVYECDYDGGNSRQLTRDAGYCVNPCYVPPATGKAPGNYLYISYQNGQPKIYISSLRESKGRRLTSLKGNQLMPAISSHREKIAFISDITGNPDLFLQPFSIETGTMGKPQQIFSAPRATQGSPTFSPEGQRIAFVSNKDGSPRIYVMEIPAPGADINNLSLKLISKANRESSAPAWSPDGTKIAYCAMTKSVRQIWVYDFDKNTEKQVTQGPGHKENPSWAPNSLHLSFNSTGPSGSEIYIMNLHQSEAVKITSGAGEKRFPNWEPAGIHN